MLSRQLAPVLHACRQQLIDQARDAANASPAAAAAGTSATSADSSSEARTSSSNARPATAHFASAMPQDTPSHMPPATVAAAATGADASPSAVRDPSIPSSPFGASQEALSPTLPLGVAARPGRRQEISGSLPLERILSQTPSPCGSTALDPHFPDSASQSPNRRTSRLESSLDLRQLVYPGCTDSTAVAELAADVIAGQLAHEGRPALEGGSAGGAVTRIGGRQEGGPADSSGESMKSLLASGLGFIDSFRQDLATEHSQSPTTLPPAIGEPEASIRNSCTNSPAVAEPQVSVSNPITDAAAAASAAAASSDEGDPPESGRPGHSTRRLLLITPKPGDQSSSHITPDSASPTLSTAGDLPLPFRRALPGGGPEAVSSSSPMAAGAVAGSSRDKVLQQGGGTAVDEGLRLSGGKANESCVEESADGDMLEGQLAAEAEARIREQQQQQQRQHPWLLYFYDKQTERAYSRYHAQQMAMVRAQGMPHSML